SFYGGEESQPAAFESACDNRSRQLDHRFSAGRFASFRRRDRAPARADHGRTFRHHSSPSVRLHQRHHHRPLHHHRRVPIPIYFSHHRHRTEPSGFASDYR